MRLAINEPVRMSVARPMRAFCIIPVSWADSDADGRCSSIPAGRPDGLPCIIGGNLDGVAGETSVGGIDIPGDICAGVSGCDTFCGFQVDSGGFIVGEGMTLDGCLELLRVKKPGPFCFIRRC